LSCKSDPVNPIDERNYQQTNHSQVQLFQKILEKNNINATVRREMGRDIQGACGQLRKYHKENKEKGKG
jgi:23S rRNA (adenine2503-C2)-methyltransferase